MFWELLRNSAGDPASEGGCHYISAWMGLRGSDARRCRPVRRAQEKQKASQQQIEELSEKVNALMLEKQQLERALERATSNNAQVSAWGREVFLGTVRNGVPGRTMQAVKAECGSRRFVGGSPS